MGLHFFCFGVFWWCGSLGRGSAGRAGLGEADRACALQELTGCERVVLLVLAVEGRILADLHVEGLVLGVPRQSDAVGADGVLVKGDVPVELNAILGPELG